MSNVLKLQELLLFINPLEFHKKTPIIIGEKTIKDIGGSHEKSIKLKYN